MVISQVNQNVYNGDGINKAWPYTFEIIDKTDVHLILQDVDGTQTVLTSDYYIDEVNATAYYPGYAPGAEPPEADQPPVVAVGQKLIVYRDLPLTQEADLGEKWPFFVIEKGLDKLTMLLQDVWGWTERNFMKLKNGAISWGGKDYRISDVANPLDQQDVATKNYVDSIIAGIVAQGSNITFCDTVAALRTADLPQGVYAATGGYYEINDGGAGVYNVRARVLADVDDGGSIIILDNGNVAELITDGTVNVKQFGAYGDGTHDDRDAIQNAFTFAPHVNIPGGTYKVINATGTGDDIYEQRADAVANNTLYPLVFAHDNGSIEINGTIQGTSCLGDVIQVTGDDVQIFGTGVIRGNGDINDTNSADPTQQWHASLIMLSGENDSVNGLLFDTPNTISINCYGLNQKVHNCSFIGGVPIHGDGTFYFHVRANAGGIADGLNVYGNSFGADENGNAVYSHVFSSGSSIIVTDNVFGAAREHAVYNYGAKSIIANNKIGRQDLGSIQSFAENCIIRDNIFNQGAGIQIQICNGTIVSGNVFKQIDDGTITFTGSKPIIAVRDYHDDEYYIKDIKIKDNVFIMPMIGETISLLTKYEISNAEISGNVIEATENTTTLSSSDYFSAIFVRTTGAGKVNKGITIKDNTIINATSYGITINNTKDCEISNNRIIDCCIATSIANGRAIYVRGTNTDIKVNNNYIEDTRDTSKTKSLVYCESLSGTTACDNVGVGISLSSVMLANTQLYQNFGNKINGSSCFGSYTSTASASDSEANNIAQSYNGFLVKLTPLDAKALDQQASAYALRGTANYGNIYFNTANNQIPDADHYGGNFLWEIFK